ACRIADGEEFVVGETFSHSISAPHTPLSSRKPRSGYPGPIKHRPALEARWIPGLASLARDDILMIFLLLSPGSLHELPAPPAPAGPPPHRPSGRRPRSGGGPPRPPRHRPRRSCAPRQHLRPAARTPRSGSGSAPDGSPTRRGSRDGASGEPSRGTRRDPCN